MTDTDAWAPLSEQLASRPPHRRPWARWFVPDLAVCFAIVSVFCSLAFFHAPQKLFLNSETGLEIRLGERILKTRSLPRTDPYLVQAGRAWAVPEWGGDVVLGLADRAAGLSGVAWLALTVLGVATWLWVRFQWAAGGNFFVTAALYVVLLFVVEKHLRATSALFGWIFLLAFLIYFEDVQPRFAVRQLGLIALTGALWANLDRSFLFLPVIAALYALGHLVRPLIWPLDRKEEWKRARWFLAVAGLTLAAGWISNPYGLRLPEAPGSSLSLLTLGLAGVGGVLALTQTKVGHFLVAVLFAGLSMAWPGYGVLAALVLLPIANSAVTNGVRKSHDLRPSLRKRVREFLQRSDHVRLIDARFSGLGWAACAGLLLLGWLMIPLVSGRTGFPRSDFPVDASAEFAVLSQNARVLAPPQYGDYLIYRFNGRVPVFVHSGIGGLEDVMGLRPGWRDQVDALGSTLALLPRDAPLAQALEGLGWRVIIEDNASVLLSRSAGRGDLLR